MPAPARLEELIAAAVAAELRPEIERLRCEVAQLRAELGDGLTSDQAAAVAGVEPKTIREWVASGRLVASRRGRHLRIARADLERATRGDAPDPRAAAAESLRTLRAPG